MKKELKGVNEINTILNEFLEEFEVCADIGSDFSYWYHKNKIEYALFTSEQSNQYFMQNFKRLAPDIECDIFLASFLHELGHHETIDTISEMDEIYCLDVKEKLNQSFQNEKLTTTEREELHETYFLLQDEYEATMWAINYIRNNIEILRSFWTKLQPAIFKFYELNEIEVEII